MRLFIKLAFGCSFLMLGSACKKAPSYSTDSGASVAPHADQVGPDGKTIPIGPDGKPLPADATPLSLVCSVDNGSRSYAGLGGQKLEAGRVEEPTPQLNRLRLKTYELLEDSYRLAFGEVPRAMTTYRQTFGESVPRWFLTPVPSVFTNHAHFILGRQAAQNFVKKDRSWSKLTSEEQIKDGCTLFAKKVWKQTPTDESVKSCVTFMTSPELAKLPIADRWSYGMAMILSSIDFIAY